MSYTRQVGPHFTHDGVDRSPRLADGTAGKKSEAYGASFIEGGQGPSVLHVHETPQYFIREELDRVQLGNQIGREIKQETEEWIDEQAVRYGMDL